MKIEQLLDIPILKVFEDGVIWKYTRLYSMSGYPYYVAPDEKNKLHLNTLMNDFLFLPIHHKDFLKDRKNYYYGYRYLIATTGSTTVEFSTLLDLDIPSRTQTKIGFEATRVRYFMDNDPSFDIVIDFMGDSMFPTFWMDISDNTESIESTSKKVVQKMIDTHCQWYINRRI